MPSAEPGDILGQQVALLAGKWQRRRGTDTAAIQSLSEHVAGDSTRPARSR